MVTLSSIPLPTKHTWDCVRIRVQMPCSSFRLLSGSGWCSRSGGTIKGMKRRTTDITWASSSSLASSWSPSSTFSPRHSAILVKLKFRLLNICNRCLSTSFTKFWETAHYLEIWRTINETYYEQCSITSPCEKKLVIWKMSENKN